MYKFNLSQFYIVILLLLLLTGLYFVSTEGTNDYLKSFGFVLCVLSVIGVIILKKKEVNGRKIIQINTTQKISIISLLIGVLFLIFPSSSYSKVFSISTPLIILLLFYIDRKDNGSEYPKKSNH